ncbi:MAG: histidine kinase [Pseudomonadota bacterium]|nr:histidine kinase [Pseudomonadota bacterium]
MRQNWHVDTRRFLLFAIAFWTLVGLLVGIQVWISMLTHRHVVPWLLFYYLLVWVAWLGPTYVIVWLTRRFPVEDLRPSCIVVHVLAASVIGVLHSVYETWLMLWMQPFDGMTNPLSDLDFGQIVLSRLLGEWILYCMVLGGVMAFEFYRRYHERALRAAQLERSLADAKLHALELQLQPHFLFNTLNAIAGLVRTDKKQQAVAMVAGLADLLRYALDHAGRQRVSLAEEMDMLERYLGIENARFPDRMSFTLALADDAGHAAVPMLILQPLAENAVRHGIAGTAAGGTIHVQANRVGERLRICMRNSGALATSRVEGIGLRNTRERLQALYGQAATFSLTAVDGEVIAKLDLPFMALD